MSFFSIKKCPICGKLQRKFIQIGQDSPAIKKCKIIGAGLRNSGCVKCGSTDRDRFVYIYLKHLNIFKRKSRTPLRILHVAPEKMISSALCRAKNFEYIMGDKYEEGYEYNENVIKLDVRNLPYEDEYFDMVICNHVLEHINDDLNAMKEIWRVLKKGGKAILQVPISKEIENTIENISITDPNKRFELFGQSDHVRIYEKRNYIKRLEDAGFKVKVIRLKNCEYYFYGLNFNEDLYVVIKE